MLRSENQYTLVIYDYDLSANIGEPLRRRSKGDIMNVYRNVHRQLSINGYKPRIQNLNDEAFDILFEYIKKMYIWHHIIFIAEI